MSWIRSFLLIKDYNLAEESEWVCAEPGCLAAMAFLAAVQVVEK